MNETLLYLLLLAVVLIPIGAVLHSGYVRRRRANWRP
jgi:hypothetical protein